MPFDAATKTALAPFAAYVCTDQGAALAREVFAETGNGDGAVNGGGLSGAARVLSGPLKGQTVIAEIGNIPVDMACECITEICRSGADIIVLGDHNDLATYRSLLAAGALEYFEFPVTARDILEVQAKGQPASPAAHNNVVQMPIKPTQSPSIAVIGSRGGVGASLLAQNLACYGSAAKGSNLHVGLLDADLQFGTQAIDLDRDETGGLFEALLAPERIDDTFINATMDHVNDHLSLFSHQVGAGQDAAPYEGGLARLIAPLRAHLDAVVTDVPRTLILQQSSLIDQFDTLVLVIPAGFAGVNAASRLIKRVTAQNPDVRILPVVSDLRRDAALSAKDIRTTIGQDIVASLPRCDAQMTRAQRAARPMVEHQPRSPYTKAVATIWNAAMTQPKGADASQPKSLLKRLFG